MDIKTIEGRYVVYDESCPLSDAVEAGSRATSRPEDGECGRFDDMHEAIQLARAVWDRSEQRHRIVVRDNVESGRVKWVCDEVITTPREVL